MFGHIVAQKHFMQYYIRKMAYDIKVTATSNEVNVKSVNVNVCTVSGIITQIYPLALPGMILIIILLYMCCVGEID